MQNAAPTMESAVASIDPTAQQRIISMLERIKEDPHLELEARIGRYVHDRFQPGIPRGHMDSIVRFLDSCPDVVCETSQWEEEENFMFQHDGINMRTRVRFPAAGVEASTVAKTVVESLILRTRVLDVRICLARETPVTSPPLAASTDHVRIKQVRRWIVGRSPFRIDCSTVWCGKTRTETEARQSTQNGVYEVECEFDLHRDDCQWKEAYRSPARLVMSLVYKMADLLMSPGVHFELLC